MKSFLVLTVGILAIAAVLAAPHHQKMHKKHHLNAKPELAARATSEVHSDVPLAKQRIYTNEKVAASMRNTIASVVSRKRNVETASLLSKRIPDEPMSNFDILAEVLGLDGLGVCLKNYEMQLSQLFYQLFGELFDGIEDLGVDVPLFSNDKKRDVVPGWVKNDVLATPFLQPFVNFFFGQEDATPKFDWLSVARNQPTHCFDEETGTYVKSPCNLTTQLNFNGENNVLTVSQPGATTLLIGTLNNYFCYVSEFFGSGTCDEAPFGGSIKVKNLTSGAMMDVTPSAMKRDQSAPWTSACVGQYCVVFASRRDGSSVRTFVFSRTTFELVYSGKYDEWKDARSSLVVNGRLYVGISRAYGFGAVAEWMPESGLGKFRLVGKFSGVTGSIASLAYHKGRLVAGGSGNLPFLQNIESAQLVSAKVLYSPLLSTINDNADSSSSSEFVSASDFMNDWIEGLDQCFIDPSPACLTAKFSAITEYRGEVYIGTGHDFLETALGGLAAYGACAATIVPAPLLNYHDPTSFADEYCPGAPNPDIADVTAVVLTTLRSASLYRFSDFTGNGVDTIESLYGTYVHLTADLNVAVTPYGPTFGLSGFGEFFNSQIASMSVHDDKLFVGTLDWSSLFNAIASPLVTNVLEGLFATNLPEITIEMGTPGFDLFVFDGTGRFNTFAETRSGQRNPLQIGAGALLSGVDAVGAPVLFLGSSNPFSFDPNGGWELLCINTDA